MSDISQLDIFTAIGGAQLVTKVLGPTADYLGDNIKELVKKQNENVFKIFQASSRKLGSDLDKPGIVPPRVLKDVMSEGSFVNDMVTSEYFGGVLASSRTEEGRDDRGAAFIKLVSRLSSYQIRAHYIFYEVMRVLNKGNEELVITNGSTLGHGEVYIPYPRFAESMEFSTKEFNSFHELLSHAITGLYKEDLLHHYRYGDEKVLNIPNAIPGVKVQPSAIGVELYLWVHGLGTTPINAFNEIEISKEAAIEIPIDIADCRRVSKK